MDSFKRLYKRRAPRIDKPPQFDSGRLHIPRVIQEVLQHPIPSIVQLGQRPSIRPVQPVQAKPKELCPRNLRHAQYGIGHLAIGPRGVHIPQTIERTSSVSQISG